MTTVGSLFTGYGGLDMGVMIALDSSARIAWTSDVEPGPCKLAAVRWPDTAGYQRFPLIRRLRAEPPRDSHERRPDRVRPVRGGNRPM